MLYDYKYNYKYDDGMRIRIWENELPFEECIIQKRIIRKYQCENMQPRQRQVLAVELSFLGHHNNYGLLGMEYREALSETNVIININDNGEIYKENTSVMHDIVHKGLPEQYANGIIRCVETIPSNTLKQGTYTFGIAAHGEIGSSENIFYEITKILFRLLDATQIDSNIVKQLIE